MLRWGQTYVCTVSDLASREGKNQKGTEQFRLERDWWPSGQGLLLKTRSILRSHLLAQCLAQSRILHCQAELWQFWHSRFMRSSSSFLSFAGTVKLIHPFHLQPLWCLTSQTFPSFPAEMLNSNFQEDNPSFKALAFSKTHWHLLSTSTRCSFTQNLSWRDKSKPSPQTTYPNTSCLEASLQRSLILWLRKHFDSPCSPCDFLLVVQRKRMYVLVQAWNPRGRWIELLDEMLLF